MLSLKVHLSDVLLGDNFSLLSKVPSYAIRAKQSEGARIRRWIAYHEGRVAHCDQSCNFRGTVQTVIAIVLVRYETFEYVTSHKDL
jgi:hypothetical protein